MKVEIGARVPPRVSMFESRDGLGGYAHSLPPMSRDAELLQAAFLKPGIEPARSRSWSPWTAIGLAVLAGIVAAWAVTV